MCHSILIPLEPSAYLILNVSTVLAYLGRSARIHQQLLHGRHAPEGFCPLNTSPLCGIWQSNRIPVRR